MNPSGSSKVVIELNIDESKYDQSNQLVLTSESRPKLKKNVISKAKKKKLSKKKEKKLKKVLERRKKLQDRKSLIEGLKKHQLDSKAYETMVSTSELQTRGHKRIHQALGEIKIPGTSPKKVRPFGRRRKNVINTLNDNSNQDANCVGFDKSESDDSEDEAQDNSNDKIDVNSEGTTKLGDKNLENEITSPYSNQTKDLLDNVPSSKELTRTVQKPVATTKVTDEKSLKEVDNGAGEKMLETQHVPIYRIEDSKIEKLRLKLPIIGEEQTIMETIRYNPVTLICGETGSGKTTQIPQFLYEAGYAIDKKIGITQPRRVAAIAMAKRVGQEMNLGPETVSYQIRFEGNCTDSTRIKFMTDGIMFKEIQTDPLLSNYSVIVVDEAHERTIYSDILIGWLSRIVRIRKDDPLKVVIMSATLRISDFCENKRLFKESPPVIKIESRQFPVAVHFSKKTSANYIDEAYNKVCKIHRNEPPGAILVFVTGRQEVKRLCLKLRQTFPCNSESSKLLKKDTCKHRTKKKKRSQSCVKPETKKLTLDEIVPNIDLQTDDGNIDDKDELTDEENEFKDDNFEPAVVDCQDPLYCLPLYSNLSEKKQQLVFQDPPVGCRMCIIATNVAETSLTLPNIRYVVDTGKVKIKVYDQITGISAYLIDWTSKASANQRAGRAGRVGPGHCYRLYSSAIYNDNFKEHSPPDIAQKPVDDLVLQMKYMNIDNVINFPFPTPPSIESLAASEKRLALLGALEDATPNKPVTRFSKKRSVSYDMFKITKLGKVLAQFPLSPKYSKMLVLAAQHGLMKYAIYIVAGLTIQELFIENDSANGDKKLENRILSLKKKWIGTGNSLLLGDAMVILTAIGAWVAQSYSPEFCDKFKLRSKAMIEIRKLINQLEREVKSLCPTVTLCDHIDLQPPSDQQSKCLRQIILSGLFDKVARKINQLTEEGSTEQKKKVRNAYKSIELENPVFISPNSSLLSVQPEWIVYQEVYESSKHFMRNVVAIEPEWLPIYARSLCTFSKPLYELEPRYDNLQDCIKCYVTCTFGPYSWQLDKPVEIEYPNEFFLDKCRWFVRHLLEGNIIKYFKKHRSKLLSHPKVIHASYAKLLPRIEAILSAIAVSKIVTRQQLFDKWKEEPRYLLKEYTLWIAEADHLTIESSWPPSK